MRELDSTRARLQSVLACRLAILYCTTHGALAMRLAMPVLHAHRRLRTLLLFQYEHYLN